MTVTHRRLVISGTLVALVTALGTGWLRAARASHELGVAQAGWDALVAEASEVTSLRALNPTTSWAQHEPAAVLTRVNAVLAEAGIRPEQFDRLAPDAIGQARTGTGQAKRQAMRLTLSGVSCAELGAFLSRWREREPLWVPTRIELARGRESKRQGLDCAIVLTTLIAEAGP